MEKLPSAKTIENWMNSDNIADRKRGYIAYYESMVKKHQLFEKDVAKDQKSLATNTLPDMQDLYSSGVEIAKQAVEKHEAAMKKISDEMSKIGIPDNEIQLINKRNNYLPPPPSV